MYRGYGRFNGMGQAPGTPVSTTTLGGGTTTLGGGAASTIHGLPGPETWGNDPVATTLQSIGAAVVQAPYGQEEQFMGYAIQAIYQAKQIFPGNPDASMNACWTCAYVYAYYAVKQLQATGAQVQTNGQITGGILNSYGTPNFSAVLGGEPQNTSASVSGLIHAMYNSLRADTYAMGYYGGCLLNKQKGLNCAGVVPLGKLVAAGTNRITYLGPPPKAGVPAAATPAAAAAAASSNTMLYVGLVGAAGLAAYLAFA